MSHIAAVWFRSLLRAIIGGGATAVMGVIGTSLVLPAQVNTGEGLHTALTLMAVQFVIGAAVALFMYLQKSPLPDWDGATDRRELSADVRTQGGKP